ncbi:uncharacterized protein [Henckelia pumila]|uniref:uncharacterized protein n=1 Tax=Henckelia pumila TaxID=405737 RepID=UPI003C6E4F2D
MSDRLTSHGGICVLLMRGVIASGHMGCHGPQSSQSDDRLLFRADVEPLSGNTIFLCETIKKIRIYPYRNSRQMENMKWQKLLQEYLEQRLAWFLPFPFPVLVPPPPLPEFVIISAPHPTESVISPSPPPDFSLSPPSTVPSLNPVSPPSPLPSHDRHVSPPSFYAPAERPSAQNRTSREYRRQLLIVTSAI